jgi:hypothetical protein
VRDLDSGLGFRVDLPDVVAVSDVWWTDGGLLVRARERESPGSTASETIFLVARDGAARRLWDVPTTPATPVAATPLATPAGG